jgi:mRNA interferase RelE/StbE
MPKVRKVVVTKKFERNVKSLKDRSLSERVKKVIEKVIEDPWRGKPLRFDLRGERSIHIRPYRLIYAIENDTLVLLRFLHRKKVYR